MKVLMINSVCGYGSTGRICADLAAELEANGHEVKIAYGRETVPEELKKYAVRIGNELDVKLHWLKTRLLDAHGLGSSVATRHFLKWAEEYQPDLLWIHNIHGYYINYKLLFDWIKKHPDLEVRWTLHDCWPFTGHCSYFTAAKCEQWRKLCVHCPQKNHYPSSVFLSRCKQNYMLKYDSFNGVNNMTLITPSQWLADLVKHSFLKGYPVCVRNNTIDTTVFKPTLSNFRDKYGLHGKKIVLGVASVWDELKGLNDFITLASMLDKSYAIVLVGLNDTQCNSMPNNIVAIKRTNNAKELAEIYTAADVFVNPTYEDNYPTVNLESIACGTPVITYNTGGSPESASENGFIVETGDVAGIIKCLSRILNKEGERL